METERNGKTEHDAPFVLHGYNIIEDGEVCYEWWLFDNEQIATEINASRLEEDYEDYDLAYELTGKARYYSGPGRSFGDDPFARVGKYHTLVTRRTGLDI